jgi:sigma-B regulation protein RsbU (phosphoserine phosphatase)
MCEATLEAGEVQQKMMPRSFSHERIEVLVEYLPAVRIGGDYAYINWITADKLYLVVADVAGHGITSSLIMNRMSTEFDRKLRVREDPLATIAMELNQWMHSRLGDLRHYATAFLGLIDFTAGTLTYLSCGHPPQLLWSGEHQRLHRLESQVTPLGLVPKRVFGEPTTSTVRVNSGDKLVLYTDGLTDATLRDSSEFGVEGIVSELAQSAEGPGMGTARNLVRLVRELGHGSRPDDVLFVFADIKRTGIMEE